MTEIATNSKPAVKEIAVDAEALQRLLDFVVQMPAPFGRDMLVTAVVNSQRQLDE